MITVIGGSGFLGTALCEYFAARQISFEIVDIKMSRRFPDRCKIGDVRDLNSLRATVIGNVVVNLAAVHRDNMHDKREYSRTNVLGAENTVRLCNEKGIRKIVFTSTVAVYGFAEADTGEDGPIAPFNEYGRTKHAAEQRFQAWHALNPENALIILRPTVIFGEGNRGNVFNLFNQISSGQFIMIGDGLNRKSMAYVHNVAAFLGTAVASDIRYGVFNYVDGPDMDMNTLVALVRHKLKNKNNVGIRLPYWAGLILGYLADTLSYVTGKTLPVSAIRIKKFCSSSAFSSNKSSLDGFRAPYTLAEGLHRTLHGEFIAPDPIRETFETE